MASEIVSPRVFIPLDFANVTVDGGPVAQGTTSIAFYGNADNKAVAAFEIQGKLKK